MRLFKSGVHAKIIRWIGYFFLVKSGHSLLTEYAVLESMNQEINLECKTLTEKALQDYEKTMKSVKT